MNGSSTPRHRATVAGRHPRKAARPAGRASTLAPLPPHGQRVPNTVPHPRSFCHRTFPTLAQVSKRAHTPGLPHGALQRRRLVPQPQRPTFAEQVQTVAEQASTFAADLSKLQLDVAALTGGITAALRRKFGPGGEGTSPDA